MAGTFSLLILSCLGIWITDSVSVAGEVQHYYIGRPSQPQSCDNQCSCSVCYDITLSQFIKNFWTCHCNDVTLIFLSGNYNLESELIVENVHSFSMYAWPGSSTKVEITCGHNARFEFRNVSTVTVSGMEFVGCFENNVVAVDHFQLENSGFFSDDQALAKGTVLSIEESTAYLNKVVFLSILNSTSDAPPDLKNCTAPDPVVSTIDRVTGILLKRSSITITRSWFEGNSMDLTGAVIYDEFGSNVIIFNTTFVNNSATKYSINNCYSSSIGGIVRISKSYKSTWKIHYSKFLRNSGGMAIILTFGGKMQVLNSNFINNAGLRVLYSENTSLSISHSDFDGNENFAIVEVIRGTLITIDHTKFFNNHGLYCILVNISNTAMVTVTHSDFLDNIAGLDFIDGSLIYLDGDVIIVRLNKFINDRANVSLVYIPYYAIATAENITDNVFHNNSAAYEVYIRPFCRSGLSLSLGSSHCIPCSDHWHQNLIGIVAAAFVAGIALVIFLLALNMTVAIGTLNGILFYANVVAAHSNTYLLRFRTINFATVLISWLNLNVGFDICFIETEFNANVYKPLLQLAFPAYVIVLVIIVMVASECSSKFAKILGRGNPVAVLATMVLLSYAKFFNAILVAFSSLYRAPYGSRYINVSIISLLSVVASVHEFQTHSTEFIAISYTLIAVTILLLFLCVMYTILVFSWQWLLLYQDKPIFRWVRYQKLRHFLEPYHAPYTVKYRYWTGLLLFARFFLYLISFFFLNPHVDLMATILIVGGLIFLKGVTAKRVYKNWPLDVMETFIYFNLVAFSALTWYILDFGGNQVALAYTSVMIIFMFLLGVIIFHVLRYTRLYKCSFIKKSFKWTSSKLLEKTPQDQPSNDAPDELDGYRLVRSVAGDQNLPTVTYSVVGLSQSQENTHQKNK